MSKKQNLPAQPFYWGDWFKAMDVQSLQRDVRCLWFEMVGRMWESNERGYLTVNGKPMENFAKGLLFGFGENVDEYLRYENILEQAGIFSRRESDGAIYCRKIVNDIELSKKRAEAGKKGGDKAKRFCLDFAQAKTQANSEDEDEDETEDTSSLQGESAERGRKRKRTPSTKFIKPTLEQAKAFIAQHQYPVDADRWYNHYEANGWKVGRNPMKDWRAAIRTWANTADYKPAPLKGGDPVCKKHPLDTFFAAGISIDRITAAIKDAGADRDKTARIQQYMLSKGAGVYRLYEQAIDRMKRVHPQGAVGSLVRNVSRKIGGQDAKG